MRTAFVFGVVAALLGVGVVAAAVIVGGLVDVAATRTNPAVDRLLAYASIRSIARHAGDARNPLARDPGAVKRGLEHYRDDCVQCHGAPGAHPEEFAAGLHPRPPDLASPEVQKSFTDGMLYAAVADGIGSTGMPAFRTTHSADDIWSIVAFIRHLPSLTPDERRELGRETGHEADHERASEAAAPPPAQDGTPAATPASPGQHVHTVQIASFKFVPATLEVHVGDVVEWKNDDLVAHTATADDHGFDTGQIDGGKSRRVVLRNEGRFAYFCRYHPEMKATLVVR